MRLYAGETISKDESMGQKLTELSERLIEFIREQHLFFVGTATEDSRVNISPKGMDSLNFV